MVMDPDAIITGTVYRLTAPSGRVFVGRTVDLRQRLRDYRGRALGKNSPIYQEIRHFGFDTFRVEVLEQITGTRVEVEAALNVAEAQHIANNRAAHDCLNVYRFDSNIRRRSMPAVARERIRQAHTGRKHTATSILRRAGANAYQARAVRSEQLGRTFATLKEAAAFVGVAGGCKISECIRGQRSRAGTHPVTREPITDWRFVDA